MDAETPQAAAGDDAPRPPDGEPAAPPAPLASSPPLPPPEPPAALAALRERTPELELLVSGAVLFALFRLSDLADETFLGVSVNLGGAPWMAAMIAYEYTKLILYTLIVAFVVHLAARAWWIGLIGVDAVYPRGPRWEELKYGPATVELLRRRTRPLPERIAQANAVASTVFATGLAFALLFVLSVLGSAVAVLLGWAVARAVPGADPERTIFGLLLGIAGVLIAVSLVDKLAGRRLLAGRRRADGLRRAVAGASALTGALLVAPITLPIATNLPKRRVYAGFIGGLALVTSLFLVRDVLLRLGAVSVGSHAYLPAQPGAAGLDPAYYEAYRPAYGAVWELPSLPDEVLDPDEAYLRLFVPFSPERVDRGAAQRCPGLLPAASRGLLAPRRVGRQTAAEAAAALAARDCLVRLVTVTLDGRPLPARDFVLAVHPLSRARGLALYLPAARLAPGMHRLVVAEARLRGARREPRVHHLPFWR